jgi:DNA primase
MKLDASVWKMTVPKGRLDWSDIKDRIDLTGVAINLFGPAPGRRGGGRRSWWRCPFHEDHNPSFCIKPGGRQWRCWGCGLKGDAIDLVCRLNPGWTFPEAVAYLAGKPAPSGKPTRRWPPAAVKPAKVPGPAPELPSGLSLADALTLVEEAAAAIWMPEGAKVLAYLHDRGLNDETIKAARLGWTPKVSIPITDGLRYWQVSGIVVPWIDDDRLAMVKIRRPSGSEPKYVEAYRDRPGIYRSPAVIRPGKPLVVCEGELDCRLLGQALDELAAVVTLGSASAKPEAATLMKLLAAVPWYVATDADDAGDRSASWWPARAIRVRPPEGKDWTEAAQAGINLRRWWTDRLGGIDAPVLATWDELAADPYAMEERAAIMEFA